MSTHSLNAHTDYEKKMLLQDSKIHNLGSFKRVWVIGAVRGKASLFEKVCEKVCKCEKKKKRERKQKQAHLNVDAWLTSRGL